MSYKILFRKIEKTLETIERSEEPSKTIVTLVRTIVDNFESELGISGGRLYRQNDGSFDLVETFGRAKPVEGGFSVPRDYFPIAVAMEEGIVLMDESTPGYDARYEREIGVRRFAAVEVGEGTFLLAFDVADSAAGDDIRASLQIFRLAINQKIRTGRLENILLEARSIQRSILPKRVPELAGYELAGRSDPAEIVGGDFYDFLPISPQIVGLAIADASGHGLPAALQVRDVYMGLRMGVERDFKIVRTIERLNRIIHSSQLVTKFVSLFYGEIEADGLFIFTNAGHNPPLLIGPDVVRELTAGGLVLGLNPNATYQRGFANVRPGDVLVFYTDGITESRNAKGEEFGTERIVEVVRANPTASSEELVRKIFDATSEFTAGEDAEDDRTVVVVRRVFEAPPFRPSRAVPAAEPVQ